MPTLAALFIVFAVLGQDTKAAPRLSDGFQLQDFRGAIHSLDDVRDRKMVVIAFLGVECPVVSQYAPRLVELAGKFEPKGVAFFAIDANQQDSPSAMGRFAKENALPFPFLKDVGNELADRLRVQRTPEVVVLDAERAIRYRGRIDDQFDRGVHRSAPLRQRPGRRDRRAARRARCLGRYDGRGRLPDRSGSAAGPRRGDLRETSCAHPERPLRCLPSTRRHRPVFSDHLQAGRRLGRYDRRGRP